MHQNINGQFVILVLLRNWNVGWLLRCMWFLLCWRKWSCLRCCRGWLRLHPCSWWCCSATSTPWCCSTASSFCLTLSLRWSRPLIVILLTQVVKQGSFWDFRLCRKCQGWSTSNIFLSSTSRCPLSVSSIKQRWQHHRYHTWQLWHLHIGIVRGFVWILRCNWGLIVFFFVTSGIILLIIPVHLGSSICLEFIFELGCRPRLQLFHVLKCSLVVDSHCGASLLNQWTYLPLAASKQAGSMAHPDNSGTVLLLNCNDSSRTSPFCLMENATTCNSPVPASLSNHHGLLDVNEFLAEGSPQLCIRVCLDPGYLCTHSPLLNLCECSSIIQSLLTRVEDLRRQAMHVGHVLAQHPLLWSESSHHLHPIDGVWHVDSRFLQRCKVMSTNVILV